MASSFLRVTALIVSIAAALAGCASASNLDADRTNISHSIADSVPEWAGGVPAHVPPRSANPPAYPGVFDRPPARDARPLTAEEQKKLEADLVALRNRAAVRARAKNVDRTDDVDADPAARGRRADRPKAATKDN